MTTTETTPAETAARRRDRPDWTQPALRALGIYATSRLVVLVASTAGALVAATAGRDVVTGPWPRVPSTGFGGLDGMLRWDSAWYIRVADAGYASSVDGPGAGRNAFFPLLPALLRLLSSVPGVSTPVAGLVVATLAGAAATVLVWFLGRRLSGEATADRMACLFAFFPGSMALSMVYSEGLLLAFAAACLLALDSRRWLLAGVLGAAATASRPTGMAVWAACAWAAFHAVRRRQEWRAMLAPLLAATGVLAFFGWLWWRTGDPLAWFTAQRQIWNERLDVGASLRRLAVTVTEPVGRAGTERDINTLVPALGVVFLVVALVLFVRWRPPGTVVIYTVVALTVALVSATIGPRPRMVLGAFPLVMGVARAGQELPFRLVLAASASLLAALTLVTVASFAVTP